MKSGSGLSWYLDPNGGGQWGMRWNEHSMTAKNPRGLTSKTVEESKQIHGKFSSGWRL